MPTKPTTVVMRFVGARYSVRGVCYSGGMNTPEEDFLALLPLNSDNKQALQWLARAGGVDVQTLVARQLSALTAPMLEASFAKAVAAYQTEKKARLQAPMIFIYGQDGRKYAKGVGRLCEKEGCQTKHKANGFCGKHNAAAAREYAPVLPITVNPEGHRIDADGVQICKACDRKVTYPGAGFCGKCNSAQYVAINRKGSQS